MRVEQLVLIDGDIAAQKLIVTWPNVGVAWESAQHLPEAQRDAQLDELRERWSRISGVYIDDILKLEPMLFENDLIGPAGAVDSSVSSFIARQVLGIKINAPQRTKQGGNGS